MSRAITKLLSGTIALLVGGVLFPLVLLAMVGTLARVGFKLDGLGWACATVVSGWLAYETFRLTFNALCERWSNDPVPPRIHRWRARRIVVRTT